MATIISLKIFSLFLIISSIMMATSSKSTSSQHEQTLKRVCYLRPESNFPIDMILKLKLCTHIIFAFVTIDGNSSIAYDNSLEEFVKQFKSVMENLKQSDSVKLLFSVGGGGVGGWEMAASTEERRKLFVKSILDFIHRYNLDGVDIDWEFPAWPKRISKRPEKNHFIYLLKEIREQFDEYEKQYHKHLLLTVAVASQLTIIRHCYKHQEMVKYVDFINLMTYDFYIYKWYLPLIGHNSALFPSNPGCQGCIDFFSTFNTEWAANYWNELGFSKDKIMVGIPTYGKKYILFSKHHTKPGSWAIDSEDDHSYTQVCEFLKRNGTIEMFDEEAQVPYAYNEDEWISYENEKSATKKAEWIKQNQFGGAMLFSLNADDFKLGCIDGQNNNLFPIHSAVRDVLIQ